MLENKGPDVRENFHRQDGVVTDTEGGLQDLGEMPALEKCTFSLKDQIYNLGVPFESSIKSWTINKIKKSFYQLWLINHVHK